MRDASPTLNASAPDGADANSVGAETDPEDADSIEAIDVDVWEYTSDPEDKLTIDCFSRGSPGAPIPGALQGQSEYQSHSVQGASLWAPFQSQCDWDIALWAKTRRPSSTALTELLQYPEV